MRPRHALLVLAFLALPASSAFAHTYGDTLTTIALPLPNIPVIVRPGDSFTAWAIAPSTASGWTASLRYGSMTVPLAFSGGGWQSEKGRFELSFTLPPFVPEEMYALVLASDSTPPDTSQHCVKVIGAYATDYYFAQISDTHLPEHTFSTTSGIDSTDTTGIADYDAVVEDLNIIHPEFILHSGDLVNEGELEEYLGMYEMGRAQRLMNRLRDPMWVVTGNHDIGGWGPTAPPDGTARKNWWRQFGWKFLANPLPADPRHTQDFTFDYGPLHVIGLEAYINNGSYDHYMQNIWGAQSFTADQMSWLQADIAAQPPGTHKLLFYHYDFGGTLANGQPGTNFTQINPAALGLDGAIWGHNHGVAEGNRTAQPFNLGLQSVIDRRVFRIFRVSNGVLSPGPMHRSGGISGTPDSLSLSFNGPNNGTRSLLTATVTNRFGEAWERARLQFNMVNHDSSFVATGGTIAQVVRQGGMANVTVSVPLAAGATAVVTVQASASIASVPESGVSGFALRAIEPNPFRSRGVPLAIHFTLPVAERVQLAVMDVTGRVTATLVDHGLEAGPHIAGWDGRRADGQAASPGVYVVRLTAGGKTKTKRFSLTR